MVVKPSCCSVVVGDTESDLGVSLSTFIRHFAIWPNGGKLLISKRFLFNFNVFDPRNLNIHVFSKRDMLKIKKSHKKNEGPCQANRWNRFRAGFYKKSTNLSFH